jgi:hypothetical protein
MKLPANLKPGIWGAVIGAVAISVVGFSSLGLDTRQHRRPHGLGARPKRCCRRADADLHRAVPAAGRCVGEAGRVQQGFDVLGSAVVYRKGRVGDSTRRDNAEFRRRQRLRRTVGQTALRTAPTLGSSAAPASPVQAAISSVTTVKLASVLGPKVVVIATSAASRPRAISARPMRGVLWRASKVRHWPPR